jgi:hypothetical protein
MKPKILNFAPIDQLINVFYVFKIDYKLHPFILVFRFMLNMNNEMHLKLKYYKIQKETF